MKRKRILKILKFKGGEGLNLTCCGSGYAVLRQMHGESPRAYKSMACLQTPIKRT